MRSVRGCARGAHAACHGIMNRIIHDGSGHTSVWNIGPDPDPLFPPFLHTSPLPTWAHAEEDVLGPEICNLLVHKCCPYRYCKKYAAAHLAYLLAVVLAPGFFLVWSYLYSIDVHCVQICTQVHINMHNFVFGFTIVQVFHICAQLFIAISVYLLFHQSPYHLPPLFYSCFPPPLLSLPDTSV